MLNAGAEPLAAALGFASPTTTRASRAAAGGHAARSAAARSRCSSRRGANRLDPLWREAVTEASSAGRPGACSSTAPTSASSTPDGSSPAATWSSMLDQALDDPRAFAAFWTVMNAHSLEELVNASDRHASGVLPLAQGGVLAASADVLAALAGPTLRTAAGHLDDAFEQALTIVYRILFLLFAEARALVPVWHPVYRDSYSLDALRDGRRTRRTARWASGTRCARSRASPMPAAAPATCGSRRSTDGCSRPARTPLAERRDLDDEAARRAVLALSTRPSADRAGRERNRLSRSRRRAARRGVRNAARLQARRRASRRGADRGRRASRSAPDRARERRPARSTRRSPSPNTSSAGRSARSSATPTPDRILQLRVVDPAMGSGAFLVAACRYLAAAYEAALVRAGGCHAQRHRRARTGHDPPNRGRTLPVRRRPQPDGRAARPAVAVAHDARRRSAAQLSRSSAAGGRQPARRVARRPSPCAPVPATTSVGRSRTAAVRRRGACATRCARSCPCASRSSRCPTTPSSRFARRNGRLPR